MRQMENLQVLVHAIDRDIHRLYQLRNRLVQHLASNVHLTEDMPHDITKEVMV